MAKELKVIVNNFKTEAGLYAVGRKISDAVDKLDNRHKYHFRFGGNISKRMKE